MCVYIYHETCFSTALCISRAVKAYPFGSCFAHFSPIFLAHWADAATEGNPVVGCYAT